MKTRIGFVSNSSSTSFMVAVKKGKTTGKITIVKEIDLNQYVSTTIETAENLYEYFYEQHGSKDDWMKETLKEYNLALKELANGKIILAGDLGDDGSEPEEALLCNEGIASLQGKDITVIHSEAGY